MERISQFFNYLLSQFSQADFSLLAIIEFSAFALIFAVAFFGCVFSARVRSLDKRAFLYIVNAFAALTLAVFLTRFELAQSVAAASVFWCAGYLLYGVLCLFRQRKPQQKNSAAGVQTVSQLPTAPQRQAVRQPVPSPAVPPQQTAQNTVRLDHALSISDKLLMKNLGRGDRQELEKIKTALTVMKVKGIISPQEGEDLNEMFNALLKFMAKYDL